MRRILSAAFSKILHNISKNIDLVAFPKPAVYEKGSTSAADVITKLLSKKELLK